MPCSRSARLIATPCGGARSPNSRHGIRIAMLEANLKTQLKAYLEKVSRPIEIVASLDNSPKSVELQGLLHEIATLSDRIAVIEKRDDSERKPSFSIGEPG